MQNIKRPSETLKIKLELFRMLNEKTDRVRMEKFSDKLSLLLIEVVKMMPSKDVEAATEGSKTNLLKVLKVIGKPSKSKK